MTQRRGSRDVRIIRRIADEEMDMRTEKERWFSYALDLERLRLDERLVRVTLDSPCDDAPVVYLHVVGDELQYVGQTLYPSMRREQHRATREWDAEYVLIAPEEFRDEFAAVWLNSVEGALIGHLRPPYNRRDWGPGASRPHIWRHIKEHGFRLPDGITVGKPVTVLVQARSWLRA